MPSASGMGTKTQTRVQSDVVVRIRGMLRDGDAIAYAKEDENSHRIAAS